MNLDNVLLLNIAYNYLLVFLDNINDDHIPYIVSEYITDDNILLSALSVTFS